ncbi:hypothetical protein D9757_010282 [Collybiopsis confluens]|uniref:Ubiquitin-like protease family profile domain-containing protein n=1 Tax=Collybiopsis confluens TaxID=2823264 RepID=A0A8H5HAJ3_9AGAR|nr:hypothetical protein D9757_010282 [Collybiopsis confluens]
MSEGKIPNVATKNFSTLGVGQWVDDEIMNYFITKWCQRSRILGLNTFFACRNLFQDDSCSAAKSGTLTAEDERKVLRWCAKTAVNLKTSNWDSAFIPINENGIHWYSAYIDFRLKHIQVFDSLETTCIANRNKPISLQKNMNLMLVLMWLAEVLARLRGDPVSLKNDPETDWGDREVGFAFTANMVGKRARLARELLSDCGLYCHTKVYYVTYVPTSIIVFVDPVIAFGVNPDLYKTRQWILPVLFVIALSPAIKKNLHMDMKNDQAHRVYNALQSRRLSRWFNSTADAAFTAATTSSQPPVLKHPKAASTPHSFQERAPQLPMADDMDVDMSHVDLDDCPEGGIDVKVVETDEGADEQDDLLFTDALDAAADIMLDHANAFNFLADTTVPGMGPGDTYDEDDAHLTRAETRRPINRLLLDEKDDSQVFQWHPDAGRVYGYQPDSRSRKKLYSGIRAFKVMSIDHFLREQSGSWPTGPSRRKYPTHLSTIPQIKESLGVSYKNARAMLELVDQIPDRCGTWYAKELSFKDRPEEKFVIHHRNPIDAIKALWAIPPYPSIWYINR